MADQTIAEKPEQWKSVGEQFGSGLVEAWIKSDVAKTIIDATGKSVGAVMGAAVVALAPIGIGLAQAVANAEDIVAPALADMSAAAVNDIFGTNVPASAFSAGIKGGRRVDASEALGRGIMEMLGSKVTTTEPGDAAAARYVTAMTNMALEGWYQKWFFEFMTSLIPQLDIGKIENFGCLDDKMVQALGLNRISRRVLSPLVDATIVAPFRAHVNRQHRPELLSASACARQISRDPTKRERWTEELRRQGYSDERIEVLLNEQRKFFSASDVRQFVARGWWTNDQGLRHLRDQGYDENGATDAIRLEGLRRIEQLEQQEANAIIGAYVAGDIDRGTFVSLLGTSVTPQTERTFLTELGEVRRAANVKRLSLGQVEAMVKSKVLSIIDYRHAAEREGYPDNDVAALELQLRWEMDKAREVAEHRAEQAAERELEKAERDAERVQRLAAVAAARALERRGSEADLEAAAIRGLITIGRVGEVYAAKYDPDTVAILLDELTDRRAEYVARLAAAAEARKRAAIRSIDVGALERAVMERVITLDQFRRQLDERGFAGDDAAILTDTLAARLEARDAAEAARDEAIAAARIKRIDLGRLETLVRRGHRSLSEYDRTLEQLGFDDAARAAMRELLQLRIDDDAAAVQLRAAAAADAAVRDLSLEQFRRAVIIGLTPIADFTPWLLAHGYTVPDAAVLRAELVRDVDEARAAQSRRAEADRRSQTGRVPLSDVRRAARLALIPVDAYYARLREAGYTDDDVAIESDLLAAEIGRDAALRAAADERAAAAGVKGLTLSQVAAAVVAGAATIADYTARALAIGLSGDDADTLTRTLQAELDAAAAARDRREQLAADNAARELSRADVEKAVRAGLKTIDDYAAWLLATGYAADDAALLVALLEMALDAGTGTGDVDSEG